MHFNKLDKVRPNLTKKDYLKIFHKLTEFASPEGKLALCI